MKSRIIIKNVGPIKNVDFEINKVNVLMGPQSSGKSTIAKIISYCQWVEKRVMLDGGSFNYDVRKELLNFHRLGENYFNYTSYFSYHSDNIDIEYSGKKLIQNISAKSAFLNSYKKTKNIYIPSERNFVSVIPNLSKYKETNDNIMSFVYDWFTAKRAFDNSNFLSVLNLDVQFYTKSDSDVDIIKLQDKSEIFLREGSSGLQSVIPLVLLVEYLSNHIYNTDLSSSVDEREALNSFLRSNTKNFFNITKYQNINDLKSNVDFSSVLEAYFRSLQLNRYHTTKFIIEEPEQNLFPTTQRSLVNYLFEVINGERDHSLLLTTHSPFVLYAINNCIMGYQIKQNLGQYELLEFANPKSWINPEKVSIWQVDNGQLVQVQESLTRTVSKHYFNEITKEIMDEYLDMLSHFQQ